MSKIKKAIIPAAGYGTRFLPITKGVPKEMLPIVDKPAIQYIVEEVIDAGINDIVIVVNNGKQAIKNYFGYSEVYDNLKNRELLRSVDRINDLAKIRFVLQEPMRGNGDAVLVAKKEMDGEPFAVVFGDDVVYNDGPSATAQLCSAFEKTGTSILGVQRCAPEIATTCGCVLPGETDGKFTEMLDIIEKPPIDELPSNLVSLGRFVLTPEIFYELENAPMFKGEIYLTVAIRNLLKKQKIYAYEFDGKRYDMGNKLGFCKANVEYGLRSSFGEEFKKYLLELGEKL